MGGARVTGCWMRCATEAGLMTLLEEEFAEIALRSQSILVWLPPLTSESLWPIKS